MVMVPRDGEVLLLSYEKVKNKNNNLDKSKVEIKSAQWKNKECREEENKHKFLYWFGNNPCLDPVPKQPPVLEISNNLVKSFTSKDPQGMYPPLFSLNNQWMYPPLELIHKRCTLFCSQYYNPRKRKNQKNSQAMLLFCELMLKSLQFQAKRREGQAAGVSLSEAYALSE
ncbi:hypothetical protein GmHk_15G045173 [Glycine max]|nr:hypothetical protein GmHk_15G045173 [Glycine max]